MSEKSVLETVTLSGFYDVNTVIPPRGGPMTENLKMT